ncbi:putative entry exclusion protein TrbK-alt [Sphingomonas nostoxanthinifaciens]|uniref:putative entry exclusion protein TrbK-alt n=1 Tax=Sphingomonas nostoxanthinifaciens TaxID=2872652 RepID=UPI001CC208F1|nr:putative entry exclusion protein TrbK-alt [Sphingomonas nostoxanthinifaciens]UAK23811.1 putative entry exclusion protein TrbK-alt [Sphingomonas nostoxanthinifaciens]
MTDEKSPSSGWFAGVGWRSIAIAGSAATVGIAALIALNDPLPSASHYVVGEAAEVTPAADVDPLRAELARCRALPTGTTDERCQAAWEVNRRRFMGESRSYVRPVEPPAIEPAPAVATTIAPLDPQER